MFRFPTVIGTHTAFVLGQEQQYPGFIIRTAVAKATRQADLAGAWFCTSPTKERGSAPPPPRNEYGHLPR